MQVQDQSHFVLHFPLTVGVMHRPWITLDNPGLFLIAIIQWKSWSHLYVNSHYMGKWRYDSLSLSKLPCLLFSRSELGALEPMEMRELYVSRLAPQHLNMKTLPSFLRKVLGDSKGSCLSLHWDCSTQFP